MKRKDIVTIIISLLIISASVYFMLQLLFPQNNSQETEVSQSSTVQEVPKTIDETTYKRVEDLSDYGVPSLSGLGKKDLFAGF